VLEDYDFILRMLARYPVDLNGRQRYVCEYRARLDGSNTTPFHDLSLLDKNDDWHLGRENIRRLKRKLAFGMSFAALAKSYPPCIP
jgi:hypothetical protein